MCFGMIVFVEHTKLNLVITMVKSMHASYPTYNNIYYPTIDPTFPGSETTFIATGCVLVNCLGLGF